MSESQFSNFFNGYILLRTNSIVGRKVKTLNDFFVYRKHIVTS